MSRRLARRAQSTDDGGFTLVEVLVALAIFAIAAASLIPLMLVSAKATGTARLETQAKNLVQQQLERMRNLSYHVAHENGDFVDLLDLYYTSVNTAATGLSPTSTPQDSRAYQDNDGLVTTQYLANGAALPGGPTGAAFRVSNLQFVGYPTHALQVFTQFLRTTRTVATPPATYNSQVDAADSPPAQLVGVTVLATWSNSSGSHTYRTYTEIADGRGLDGLLSTQSRSTALRVTGTDLTGNNLLAQAGVVQTDGSVTSGSSATAAAEGARLEQVGVSTVLGRTATAAAPPSPSGTAGASTTAGNVMIGSSGSCGWASAGRTQVSDVSASTGLQQPLVPSTGGTDVRTSTTRVVGGIVPDGGGCNGYDFGFTPNADGLWTLPGAFDVDKDKPLIGVPDTSGSGLGSAAVLGSGQVAASTLVTLPIFSTAYAEARTKIVQVLPLNNAYGTGLVHVTLASASLTCVSGQATAAQYNLTVAYPGGTRNIVWSTAVPSTVTLPDPASVTFTSAGVTHQLSEYLSWTWATSVAEGDNGVSTFGPIFRLTINKAVLNTATDVTLEMGVLSCVADDRR